MNLQVKKIITQETGISPDVLDHVMLKLISPSDLAMWKGIPVKDQLEYAIKNNDKDLFRWVINNEHYFQNYNYAKMLFFPNTLSRRYTDMEVNCVLLHNGELYTIMIEELKACHNNSHLCRLRDMAREHGQMKADGIIADFFFLLCSCSFQVRTGLERI